ncbi:unnamed protein product [Adineta ricciae]|uniref:Hermes trasposase DNA-binding domain-containing protein n=1 Tax=Adineta ricciae TaxID=249248 RepID=A0A814ERU1_ADIRI|nr:unnamed protein product [Adineta ricciae]CAF1271752.1 unnamed protein product [Adineta ricciae]
MNSTSIDLVAEIHSSSSDEENEISFSSVSRVSSACCTSSLYTNKQIEFFLRTDKQKYRILANENNKKATSWWRSFGFPAVLNEKNGFERIHGYISCTKYYRTSIYGSKSGTKRFIDHANRCSPLSSQSIPNQRNPEESQATLDNIVIKKKAHITTKEQNEIKHLYAKWICEDLRPFTIVENNGFQQLAQTFIRLGSQYGCIDVKEVVRSRQAVARTVDDLAQKHRTILKSELREPLKAQAITIAPDFWTSKYNQQAFLHMMHYSDCREILGN